MQEPVLAEYIQQLTQHYPDSSLVSEFLTYAANEYAIRACVKMGDRILSTGMAAAATLEQAEDRAKLRAIKALGIPSIKREPSNPIASLSQASIHFTSSAEATEPPPIALERSKPAKSIKLIKHSHQGDQGTQTFTSSSESQNDDSQKMTALEEQHLLTPPTIQPSSQNTTQIPASNPQPPNHMDSLDMDSLDMDSLDIDSLDINSLETETTPIATSASNEDAHLSPLPETVVPLPNISQKNPATANGPTASDKAPQNNSPLEPSTHTNLVDAIAKTSVEMQRLGWDTHKGREHLMSAYGKRSRGELTDDELIDFLQFLEQQPTTIDT